MIYFELDAQVEQLVAVETTQDLGLGKYIAKDERR